jgi:hypothetical protein
LLPLTGVGQKAGSVLRSGWYMPLYDDIAKIKLTTMKRNIILFLSILTLVTARNGQTATSKKSTDYLNEQPVKGDTVQELGNAA